MALAACVSLPAAAWSGEVERNLEALIGRVAAELMAREYGTIENPLLDEWVDRVGQRVAAECPRQEFPYRFRILDTPERNAFALPGAHIFVTRGLLSSLQSDDELGAILAHEVGHIADRDFQRVVKRQLMFLGLGVVVEKADHEELLTPLRVVQVLNSLRHSRRQEDQADLRGVEYALAARYEPLALTPFLEGALGGRSRPRAWYEGVLETHPDAYKRLVRCRERSRRLKVAQPDQLAALADDLLARCRLQAAAEDYRLLSETEAGRPRGPVGLARIHLARGEASDCIEASRTALTLQPDHAEAAALLAEAEQLLRAPQVKGETAEPPGPTPALFGVEFDRKTIERLSELSERQVKDRRFNDALTWAQACDPETGDWRWLYALARTRLLLMATDRLRWKANEIAGLAASGAQAWTGLGSPADSADASGAIMWYNRGAATAVRGAEELSLAMALLPPVLATLAFTGSGDPFGRMSSSRFALIEADLLIAEAHGRKALELCRGAASDVAGAESRRIAFSLNQLEEKANGPQAAIYRGLAGVRFGRPREQVTGLADGEGGLGSVCLHFATEGARPPERDEGPEAATYEEAEAVRIVLSLLLAECEAETVGPRDASSPPG
jgi:hypothetical protein